MIERDWNIQPPSGKCSATGRPFRDEEAYYAILVEMPEGLIRQDFSVEAWASRASEPKPLSFWKSEFKAATPEPERTIAQDDAESLLRRMIDQGDVATENARYILAVMLERKKKLYHRDTIERDGRPCLIYEHKETGETFLITDPRLKLSDLHLVQMEVADLLRPSRKGGQETAASDGEPNMAAEPTPPTSDGEQGAGQRA